MIDWTKIDWFEQAEFACPCCGLCNPAPELVNKANTARHILKLPINLNSACRCQNHNLEVGGLPNSSHICTEEKESYAIDIAVNNSHYRYLLVKTLLMVGFTRIIIYKSFIHTDIDPSKPQEILVYG